MGRLTNDPTITHFSHPHPLHLSSPAPSLIPLSCAACTLPTSSSLTYTCTTCNFHLHVACSQLPPLINHPFHPTHNLTLLPSPAYPYGCFNCDACGRIGSAFLYHCSACCVDLHAACAALPLSVGHQAHPHPLTMAFFPPYENRGFSCNVCGTLGGNHWLYRCALCGFDAHLGCGAGGAQAGTRTGAGTVFGQAYPIGSVSQGFSTVGSGSGGGGLVRKVLSGIVDGVGQQLGQNLVQGFMGGGNDSSSGGSDGGGDGSGSSIFDVGSAILGSVLGGS